MIIGIDEVGDFDPQKNAMNFFVAVSIDQNGDRYKVKAEQYKQWESTIPNSHREKDEVKGRLLTDALLERFVDEVINVDKICHITVIRVNPLENPSNVIEFHKEYEIEQFEKVVELAKIKEKQRTVDGYQELIYWYKNRNYQQILKIKMLNIIVRHAVRNALGISALIDILENDPTNLLNIGLRIDRDFIRGPAPNLFWREILKNSYHEYSKEYPMLIPTTWDSSHPFIKKTRERTGACDIGWIFYEKTIFVDSKDYFEVQLADIVGTIIYRFQNKSKCKLAYKKLEPKFVNRHPDVKKYQHIILKGFEL